MNPRTTDIYRAEGNFVYVDDQLFLTVHPTDAGDTTQEQQATLLAAWLNKFNSVDWDDYISRN